VDNPSQGLIWRELELKAKVLDKKWIAQQWGNAVKGYTSGQF
jgi:hypothetical protein